MRLKLPRSQAATRNNGIKTAWKLNGCKKTNNLGGNEATMDHPWSPLSQHYLVLLAFPWA